MGEFTIYEMFVRNDCKFGFYVRRNSWAPGKIAKVVAIEFAEEGKMLEGRPPYYGGFLNPPGHRRAGKKMGPRQVTLQAPWFDSGVYITDAGGNGCWEQVHI